MSSLPLDRADLLTMQNASYRDFVQEFFQWQLNADGADLTTNALIEDPKKIVTASITAREVGVLAGREEVEVFGAQFFPDISYNWQSAEAQEFGENQKILSLSGGIDDILRAERIVLNVLSRMCGIATITKRMKALLPSDVALAATRKTLWGMMDKKAVSVGGGLSHRLGLFDAVLAKENHLAFLSHGAKTAAERIVDISQSHPEQLGAFWEIEVEDADEFGAVWSEVCAANISVPGVIMLDNFTPDEIGAVLGGLGTERVGRNIFFEASGGITLDNCGEYGASGVDIISSGFLTHTPRPIDLSLRME